jgi:hypothetical protein
VFTLLAVLAATVAPAHAFAPSSDAEAIRLARRMIEVMGGAKIWAEAKWLYVREEAHLVSDRGAIVAEYWRRFDEPGMWSRHRGEGIDRRSTFSRSGGWRAIDGTITELTREALQNRLGFWPREIYTMYHRLAREDAALRLLMVPNAPRRFLVLDDRTGEDLCWFEVDSGGAIAKWKAGFGTSEVEYVYGPLRAFGSVRMPAWGTLIDGTFRFFYTAAELRTSAPEAPFRRP